MDFVTVHTTFSSADAQLVRSRLEAANFHPNVANEASVPYAGFSESTLIRVEVPAAEATEVKEFLAAANPPEE
jgi:hypothetical protein